MAKIGTKKMSPLKAAVIKGGGGKKALKTFRKASAEVKSVAKTPGVDVKGYAKAVRGASNPKPKGIAKRVSRIKAKNPGMSTASAGKIAIKRAKAYKR